MHITTKEIIENAIEMYSGIMNFTDDDERESKEEKQTLSPIQINFEHTPSRCQVRITHIGITLFESDVSSSFDGKKSLEELALKKILNDIIISGFFRITEIKGMQPQMKLKEKWMTAGTEVRIGAKEGEITSLEEAIIDGREFVYYIHVKIFDTKKPKPYAPGIVRPFKF